MINPKSNSFIEEYFDRLKEFYHLITLNLELGQGKKSVHFS